MKPATYEVPPVEASMARSRPAVGVRRLMIAEAIAIVITLLMITVSTSWIVLQSRGRVFDVGDAPTAPVAIVLGAGVSDGEPGSYLQGRLDTALQLLEAGSIETIIVSGNEDPPDDDEVTVMRNYLQERGVAADRIIDDPGGLNTDETCRRASSVYGVRRALLVTQDFHAARAVALCRSWGIDAFGVIASCTCNTPSLIRNYAREAFLSRPAAVWYALHL